MPVTQITENGLKKGINLLSCYMQGKKDYQEKLFSNFQLSDRVPKDNFYRRLKGELDLHFLYVLTRPYYWSIIPI